MNNDVALSENKISEFASSNLYNFSYSLKLFFIWLVGNWILSVIKSFKKEANLYTMLLFEETINLTGNSFLWIFGTP